MSFYFSLISLFMTTAHFEVSYMINKFKDQTFVILCSVELCHSNLDMLSRIVMQIKSNRVNICYLCLFAYFGVKHALPTSILPWHLLGHAIMSVICFDLQFSHSTRPMTSFCIFIAYINTDSWRADSQKF
jgi:hypothetical protein